MAENAEETRIKLLQDAGDNILKSYKDDIKDEFKELYDKLMKAETTKEINNLMEEWIKFNKKHDLAKY